MSLNLICKYTEKKGIKMQALQDFINKENNIYFCISKRGHYVIQSLTHKQFVMSHKRLGIINKKSNNTIILQMNDGNQRNNPLKTPARGTTFDMNTSTTLPSRQCKIVGLMIFEHL
jgi:hypothetical protein